MNKLAERIAVPTTGKTIVEARDQGMALNAMGIAVIELRLDAIRNLSSQNMGELLVPHRGSSLLVTNRRMEEAFPDRANSASENGFERGQGFILPFRRFRYLAEMVDVEMGSLSRYPSLRWQRLSGRRTFPNAI